jgi:ribosomal 30S subunit maturation factor RimM
MNLEDSIKDVISKKLEDGTIEKLVEKQLEEGVNNALSKLFGSYGDVTEVIEKKIKSVMIPYLENYDYSEYIVKLDTVLTEVLKNTTLDNKKILTNFKDLINPQKIDVIKTSELYNKWTEFVANNVKTEGLDIDYDDGVSYKPVDVSMETEYEEERSWSSFEGAKLVFECEHDEEMNFEIRLNRWKNHDKNWNMYYNNIHDINSLRNLNEFEIFLMNLSQNGTKIELDEDYLNDEITPEKEPEPTFE